MFVTDVVTYSSLGSDLPSVMASLERQSPDLVISAGSFDDEVVLARALLESGLRPKAVGLAAAAMQEFPQALGLGAEGFLGPHIGGGIEYWFAYVLALAVLLVRPQGLFGERIIERI